MPGRVWSEWLAYFELEPFGPLQDDMRSGQIAVLMANAYRKKNSRAIKLDDFYPHMREIKPRQNAKAKWQSAKLWAMQWNAAIDAQQNKRKRAGN